MTFSAERDEFTPDSTLRKYDWASPSHLSSDCDLTRAVGREEQSTGWQRNHFFDVGRKLLGTSAAVNLTNGRNHVNPRALIDAYGDDEENHIHPEAQPKLRTWTSEDRGLPCRAKIQEREFNLASAFSSLEVWNF
ncbi:Tryptophan synthase [Psidium guajava]|nr:Tryptophan synthase [Psidium guajava]